MGQYRLSFYWYLQLGLSVRYEVDQITISIPFIEICIGLTKHAYGVRFFKD